MTSKESKPKEPTVKQRRYIDCYNGDIPSSAKEAGISYVYAKELHTKTCYAHIAEALKGRNDTRSQSNIKNRQERQEFWSSLMGTAEKDSDKLKASELLGRSEADFTDNIRGGIGSLDDLSKLTDQELKDAENDLDG